MTVRRLYGSSENVGGGRWELLLFEDDGTEACEDERMRWWLATDALFPPQMAEGTRD